MEYLRVSGGVAEGTVAQLVAVREASVVVAL